jgi:transcriptional regulator with XRE-family HTH domain
MCLDLGLSKSTLSDMKSGRKSGVSMPTAQKIAGYFGISVDELYGKDVKKEQPITLDGLSDDLVELIEHLKTLPEDKIQMLLQVAKSIK